MDKILVAQNKIKKYVASQKYNYVFDKQTGFFARWGKTKNDDPIMAPAPEIADIEVTTKCSGINGKLCPFCYKSNSPNGKNMSFETFKKIIDTLPHKEIINDKKEIIKIPLLTQVALGVDSKAESNPDLWKMMQYCREKGIIPNVTVAQITNEVADKLAHYCGAVAVSRYDNKDVCYDAVKKLTDRGMTQINIHSMIASETFDNALETLKDKLTDPRLEKLNAIVFLSLKQKGRGTNFTPLSQDKFKQLVDFAMDNKIGIGFDSCSAYKFLKSIENSDNFEKMAMYSEPCESSLFSTYFNVDGHFFPCSFSEGEGDWKEGLDIVKCKDFSEDIWYHDKTISFRKKLLNTNVKLKNKVNCRECPLFKI